MRIAAVDPGMSCGMALVDTEEPTLEVIEVGMDEIEEWLDGWNLDAPIEVLIVERWVIYPFALHKLKFHECPAAEAIGIMRSWTNRNEVELTKQMASVRVPYLKKVREQTGITDHRADAVAHALCWLKVKRNEVPDLSEWKITRRRK